MTTKVREDVHTIDMSKIDVHHHVYPAAYTKALERKGGDPSGWQVPEWTLELDKALCKNVGIKTAILSVTAPGVSIEIDISAAASLARECNEHNARIRDGAPNSYGFFGTTPDLVDDPKGALEEIAYALDKLDADGVTLFTRYGDDNHYLGHPDFNPIWEELNRRKTVVFVHPTHPVDCHFVDKHLPQPMFDYPHETGRTAMDMIVSDIPGRYPDVKVILSHAGGTMPYLIGRAATLWPYTPVSIGKSTEEIIKAAKWFYFDTALSSTPEVLTLLADFALPDHILFGSDFPNAPTATIEVFSRTFDQYKAESNKASAWTSEAGLRLFPRLA